MNLDRLIAPMILVLAASSYWAILFFQKPTGMQQQVEVPTVVFPAPVQVILYAGDRFMAANFEVIRASAALGTNSGQNFRLRAHRAASILNPCHEDNYWFGNASLSWGGSIDQGMEVLKSASQCRFWDEWPLFFYGFNQNFFYQDIKEAQRALKLASDRTEKNKAVFYTYATMLGVNQVKNTKIALRILESEKKKAISEDHKRMLADRIVRLKGLLLLREAQATYEKEFGKKLEHPDDLLSSGVLKNVPQDPLKLGYELDDGIFQLKQLKVRQ